LCYSFFCSRSNFPLCSRLRFSSSVRHGLTAASSFFDSFFCSAPAHSGPSVFIFGAGFGSSSVRCPDFFVDSSIAPKRAVVILGSHRTRWFLLRVFISSGWPPSSACNPLDFATLAPVFLPLVARRSASRSPVAAIHLQRAPAAQSRGLGLRGGVPRPCTLNVFPTSSRRANMHPGPFPLQSFDLVPFFWPGPSLYPILPPQRLKFSSGESFLASVLLSGSSTIMPPNFHRHTR
jgi:hypothetical protein